MFFRSSLHIPFFTHPILSSIHQPRSLRTLHLLNLPALQPLIHFSLHSFYSILPLLVTPSFFHPLIPSAPQSLQSQTPSTSYPIILSGSQFLLSSFHCPLSPSPRLLLTPSSLQVFIPSPLSLSALLLYLSLPSIFHRSLISHQSFSFTWSFVS